MSVRYQCRSECLAAIEAALVESGYRVEVTLQTSAGGAGAMMMSRGQTSVVLKQNLTHGILEIEIWGVGQPHAARLLESLPIQWQRWPPSSTG